ncbi:MAG: DnaJ domain-containing protein [Saprospiraceae bacterium]|nr:DnaJ domain-containing protein [Saprospiraceae bacterium]
MSNNKGGNENLEWLLLGLLIAFPIIGLFWGGIYTYNKFDNIIVIIIGALFGGFIGLLLGYHIAIRLESFFEVRAENARRTYKSNKSQEEKSQSSSNSAGTNKSGDSKKSTDDSQNDNRKDYSGSSSSSSGKQQSQEKKDSTNTWSANSTNLYQKYYTLLESRPQDDFDAIKRNYRRLVREFHPDHLGTNASDAMHKYAKEMSQKINEAYEIIKKQRGIK